MLKPPPLSSEPLRFTFTTPYRHSLSNGTGIHLLPSDAEDIVTISVGIHAGAVYDNVEGETSFAAQMLSLGTSTYTADELAVEVERRGCSLSSSASRDAVNISAVGLREHGEWLAGIVAECLLRPRFDAEEVETQRGRRLADLEMSLADPEWLAAHALLAVVYPNHPYSRSRDGSAEAIRNIELQTLTDVHSRLVTAPRDVVVAGGFDTSAMLKAISKAFADAPHVVELAPIPIVHPMPSTAYIVDRPDSVQTVLRVSMPSVGLHSSHLAAQNLAIALFGGYTLARLFSILREEKGYTYGAYASNEVRRYGQSLVVYTSVGNSFTEDTMNVIAREVGRMRDFDATDVEIHQARQFVLGHFARSSETPQQAASLAWTILQHGLADDHYTRYVEALQNVSREDLERVSASLFNPETWSIAAVGVADVVLPALQPHAADAYHWNPVTMMRGDT